MLSSLLTRHHSLWELCCIQTHVKSVSSLWIGAWSTLGIEFLIIEQAKRFDQNQIVVEARKVDPGQPLSPWRRMKLNDFDFGYYFVCYASLEPSISNHLAVKALLAGTSRFLILNLATREIICQISTDIMQQQLFQRRKKPKEQPLLLQHQLNESVPEWRQETGDRRQKDQCQSLGACQEERW